MGRATPKEEAGAGEQLLLCLLRGYCSSPDVERQIEDSGEGGRTRKTEGCD